MGYTARERRRAERHPLVGRRSKAGFVILGVGAAMVIAHAAGFKLLMHLEGDEHSWPSAIYWTITTMSTLGYGDITFDDDAGRLFSLWVQIGRAHV